MSRWTATRCRRRSGCRCLCAMEKIRGSAYDSGRPGFARNSWRELKEGAEREGRRGGRARAVWVQADGQSITAPAQLALQLEWHPSIAPAVHHDGMLHDARARGQSAR